MRRAIAGLVLALATAETARAGDVACVFENLPLVDRAAVAAAAGDDPLRNKDAIAAALDIPPIVVLNALRRCRDTPNDPQWRRDAAEGLSLGLFGCALEKGAERVLVARGATTVDALDRAWRDLEPAERARMIASHGLAAEEGDEWLHRIQLRVMQRAGWSGDLGEESMDDPLFDLFFCYFAGRAKRESGGSTF